jgi:hypothetical protein
MVHRERRWASVAWVTVIATAPPWGADMLGGGTVASPWIGQVKLFLIVLAVLVAFRVRAEGHIPSPVKFFVAYAAVAAVGALVTGDALSEGPARSLRFVLVCLAAAWLGGRLGLPTVLRISVYATLIMAAASLAARVVGLQPLVDGRLAGFLPSQHPNALAANVVAGLAATLVLLLMREMRGRRAVLIGGVFLFALVLTGSRTSLLVAALVFVTMGAIALGGKGSGAIVFTAWLLTLVFLIVAWVDSSTGSSLWNLLTTRGGRATFLGTVEVRAYAGEYLAASIEGTTAQFIGLGMELKQIDTDFSSFVTTQPIDGSWFATYAAGGLVGASLFLLGVLGAIVAAWRRSPSLLILLIPVTVGAWSESYLSDVTVTLVVFVAAASSVYGQFPRLPRLDKRAGPNNSRVRPVRS